MWLMGQGFKSNWGRKVTLGRYVSGSGTVLIMASDQNEMSKWRMILLIEKMRTLGCCTFS
jgi:hypothetical protein